MYWKLQCTSIIETKPRLDPKKIPHTDTGSGSMVLLQKLQHVPGHDVRSELGYQFVFEADSGSGNVLDHVSWIHRFKTVGAKCRQRLFP